MSSVEQFKLQPNEILQEVMYLGRVPSTFNTVVLLTTPIWWEVGDVVSFCECYGPVYKAILSRNRIPETNGSYTSETSSYLFPEEKSLLSYGEEATSTGKGVLTVRVVFFHMYSCVQFVNEGQATFLYASEMYQTFQQAREQHKNQDTCIISCQEHIKEDETLLQNFYEHLYAQLSQHSNHPPRHNTVDISLLHTEDIIQSINLGFPSFSECLEYPVYIKGKKTFSLSRNTYTDYQDCLLEPSAHILNAQLYTLLPLQVYNMETDIKKHEIYPKDAVSEEIDMLLNTSQNTHISNCVCPLCHIIRKQDVTIQKDVYPHIANHIDLTNHVGNPTPHTHLASTTNIHTNTLQQHDVIFEFQDIAWNNDKVLRLADIYQCKEDDLSLSSNSNIPCIPSLFGMKQERGVPDMHIHGMLNLWGMSVYNTLNPEFQDIALFHPSTATCVIPEEFYQVQEYKKQKTQQTENIQDTHRLVQLDEKYEEEEEEEDKNTINTYTQYSQEAIPFEETISFTQILQEHDNDANNTSDNECIPATQMLDNVASSQRQTQLSQTQGCQLSQVSSKSMQVDTISFMTNNNSHTSITEQTCHARMQTDNLSFYITKYPFQHKFACSWRPFIFPTYMVIPWQYLRHFYKLFSDTNQFTNTWKPLIHASNAATKQFHIGLQPSYTAFLSRKSIPDVLRALYTPVTTKSNYASQHIHNMNDNHTAKLTMPITVLKNIAQSLHLVYIEKVTETLQCLQSNSNSSSNNNNNNKEKKTLCASCLQHVLLTELPSMQTINPLLADAILLRCFNTECYGTDITSYLAEACNSNIFNYLLAEYTHAVPSQPNTNTQETLRNAVQSRQGMSKPLLFDILFTTYQTIPLIQIEEFQQVLSLVLSLFPTSELSQNICLARYQAENVALFTKLTQNSKPKTEIKSLLPPVITTVLVFIILIGTVQPSLAHNITKELHNYNITHCSIHTAFVTIQSNIDKAHEQVRDTAKSMFVLKHGFQLDTKFLKQWHRVLTSIQQNYTFDAMELQNQAGFLPVKKPEEQEIISSWTMTSLLECFSQDVEYIELHPHMTQLRSNGRSSFTSMFLYHEKEYKEIVHKVNCPDHFKLTITCCDCPNIAFPRNKVPNYYRPPNDNSHPQNLPAKQPKQLKHLKGFFTSVKVGVTFSFTSFIKVMHQEEPCTTCCRPYITMKPNDYKVVSAQGMSISVLEPFIERFTCIERRVDKCQQIMNLGIIEYKRIVRDVLTLSSHMATLLTNYTNVTFLSVQNKNKTTYLFTQIQQLITTLETLPLVGIIDSKLGDAFHQDHIKCKYANIVRIPVNSVEPELRKHIDERLASYNHKFENWALAQCEILEKKLQPLVSLLKAVEQLRQDVHTFLHSSASHAVIMDALPNIATPVEDIHMLVLDCLGIRELPDIEEATSNPRKNIASRPSLISPPVQLPPLTTFHTALHTRMLHAAEKQAQALCMKRVAFNITRFPCTHHNTIQFLYEPLEVYSVTVPRCSPLI